MGALTGSSKDGKKDETVINIAKYDKKDELPKLKLVDIDKAKAFKLPEKPKFKTSKEENDEDAEEDDGEAEEWDGNVQDDEHGEEEEED